MNERLPELDTATVLGPASGVVSVTVGDEVVVYRVADAASLVLNSTAGLLWQCLDGASPLADIVDDIARAFGADRADVERDCVPMVGIWLAENLLEEVNGA